MDDRPFTRQIAEAVPDLWENFLRAVERERQAARRRRARSTKDRRDYFHSRYEARKATGLCKLCDNPSGRFVLCIFHRAAMSFKREKAEGGGREEVKASP